MSHAIRIPINSVICASYLMLKTPLSERQTNYISCINTAANALLGIINDILEFSQAQSDQTKIARLPFSLSSLLTGIAAMHGLKAEERGITLKIAKADDVPDDIIGDSLRLGQILTNLVGNAIKFTEEGSVEVWCELDSTHATGFESDCMPPPSDDSACRIIRLHFIISDTGIGMTPEQVQNMFRPYAQADGAISHRFGGTGLGLSISKRLVNLMGGDIWIDSTLGRGSKFHFTAAFGECDERRDTHAILASYPVPESTYRDVSIKTLPEPDSFRQALLANGELDGLSALLVEDNEINREIAVELLSLAGVKVITAENGSKALSKLTARAAPRFDVILMDISMPVMDGFEATRRIRALKGHEFTPIIAMTAHALETDKKRCFEAGMNAHVAKPLEIDKFFDAIKSCVKDDCSQANNQAAGQSPAP